LPLALRYVFPVIFWRLVKTFLSRTYTLIIFTMGVITFQRFFSLTLREIFQSPLFSWPRPQEHVAELTLPVNFLELFCSRVSKCCFSLIFTPFGYRTSDPRELPWDIFQKDRLNQLSWRESTKLVPTQLIKSEQRTHRTHAPRQYFLELFCSRVSKCCFSLIFTPFGFEPATLGVPLETSFKKIDSTNYHGGRALNSYLLSLLYFKFNNKHILSARLQILL
jgi:hypothetical protein